MDAFWKGKVREAGERVMLRYEETVEEVRLVGAAGGGARGAHPPAHARSCNAPWRTSDACCPRASASSRCWRRACGASSCAACRP